MQESRDSKATGTVMIPPVEAFFEANLGRLN